MTDRTQSPRRPYSSRYPLGFLSLAVPVIALVALTIPAGARAFVSADPVEAAIWLVFLAAANLLMIPMLPESKVEVTLSAPVSIAAAVLFPVPEVVALVALGSLSVHELRREAPVLLALWNRSQYALSAGAAALAAAALPEGNWLLRTIAAVFIYQVVNNAAVAFTVWLMRRVPLERATRETADPFPRFALDFALLALLALLIVVAHDVVGPWALALIAVPLLLGYSALRSARESEDRAEELADRVRELETLNALGSELLSAHRLSEVLARAVAGLNHALATDDIVIRRDGDLPAYLDVVKIPGCEPAAVGVPQDLSERSAAVVEAAAGLTGLALQRLDLEEELAEVEKARRRLSEQILEEGQSERSRIALAIHDDVLPYLAAAEMQADNVRTALGVADADRAGRLAGSTIAAVRDGLEQLREVLDTLQRQVLIPGDLRPNLERALADLELGEGTTTRIDAPCPLPAIPLAVEILVLEIVRGCLANVARHARAEHVTLRLDATEDRVRADVLDDGVGFDPGEAGQGRHGLTLMTQRVELARGSLVIESSAGKGTHVRLEVPL